MTYTITSEELAKIESALSEHEISLFDACDTIEDLEARCERFAKVRDALQLVKGIRVLRKEQKTS